MGHEVYAIKSNVNSENKILNRNAHNACFFE